MMNSDEHLYPNRKGLGFRSPNKKIRISTHIEVLKSCFSVGQIDHVIEHGMGFGSTPFFHESKVKTLLSFENVPIWQKCEACDQEQQVINHKIVIFDQETYVKHIEESVQNSKYTLAFIDSHPIERNFILKKCLDLGVPWIVEHDAETFTREQLFVRRRFLQAHDYVGFQFIKLEPETSIYVKEVPDFIKNDLEGYIKL